MKKEKQKYIIILLMITLLTLTYGIKNLKKTKYEELPEVKLKEKIDEDKTFAIMIQTNNGYEEYKSKDNKWPGDDYFFKEAKCTDNNGALVENAITFESISKTVILETDKTVVCTLYFDESLLVKLKENEKLLNKNNLSSDLQGGIHRYQGTDDVANWICFGTTDKEQCTDARDSDGNNVPDGIDKYMYRIIGINPDGELYLLKETFYLL